MRSIVTSGIVFLLLLCGCACAQDVLTLSAHELTAGEELTIEALDAAEKRSFTLFRDGEQVNTGAVTEARHAAMIPQVPGQYVLSMQPEGGQPVTAAFTVYDRLSVNLRVNLSSVKVGEPVTLTAEAVGGTEKKEYEYSVWRGTERIARKTGTENSYVFIPLAEGSLTFSVEVTDGLGGKVSAVADPVMVQGPAGMAVSGDLSPMFVQGGIRGLKVESPGPWSARTEQGFVTLLNTCGDSGDLLYYAMDASGIGERSAVVNIESLGLSRRVTLRQSGGTTRLYARDRGRRKLACGNRRRFRARPAGRRSADPSDRGKCHRRTPYGKRLCPQRECDGVDRREPDPQGKGRFRAGGRHEPRPGPRLSG